MEREGADSLLERDSELEQIDGLIDEAAAGRGRLLVIEGAAGLGKSSLLSTLADRADASMRVLSATASEFEREFPFGVVRQLFERELADEGKRERALSGAAADAAGVLGFGSSDDTTDASSFATLNALYWLTVNLADDYPLALAIDDLHHVDIPSLRFLGYLGRRLEGLSVLTATSWRSTDAGVDPALVAEIAHDRAAVSLTPGELSHAAVASMIARRLGSSPDGAFHEACAEITGGNPLLLEQLLAGLHEDGVRPTADRAPTVREIGPRAISRTVFARLARLDPDSVEVARSVAILGDGASSAELEALTGLATEDIERASVDLARVDILRPRGTLAFTHGLLAEVIRADMAPAERERRHARAASMLRDLGEPSERVAAQLLVATPGQGGWAANLLLETGRAASTAGAPGTAAAYLGRALEEGVEDEAVPGVTFELAVAEAVTDGDMAGPRLRRAHELSTDPVQRAQIAMMLGQLELPTGAEERGIELVRRAITELGSEHQDQLAMLRATELSSGILGQEPPEVFAKASEYRDVPEHPEEIDPGSSGLLAVAAIQWALEGGPVDRCSELALAALASGSLGDANGLLAGMALWALEISDHPRALAETDRLLERARKSGTGLSVGMFESCRTLTLLDRGSLEEAIEQGGEAKAKFELFGTGSRLAAEYLDVICAWALMAKGDIDAAWRRFELTSDPGELGESKRMWLSVKADLLAAERRHDELFSITEQLESNYGWIRNPHRNRWRSLRARVLHAQDRGDEALPLVQSETDDAREFGGPSSLSRSLRELAAIEGSIEPLEEAVAITRESPARLEYARCLAALGGALRRNRRPSDAREPLREGLEIAGACAAAGLATQIRDELHASGARPRRDALSGVESLTTSEHRVAQMAAGGATNKEIAQELYVTPKTVELHLTNSYRKLDIGGRRELPEALRASPR